MDISARKCEGCDEEFVPHPRERNRRKWCGEACRERHYRRTRPDYAKQANARKAARRRENYRPVVHRLECRICGEVFTAKRKDTRYCSNPCRYRAAYLGRRGRRAGVVREPYTRLEIAERDGWSCGLCGDGVDPELNYPDLMSGSVDHIVPLSLGGADTPDNVHLAHLYCNWVKGARVA